MLSVLHMLFALTIKAVSQTRHAKRQCMWRYDTVEDVHYTGQFGNIQRTTTMGVSSSRRQHL